VLEAGRQVGSVAARILGGESAGSIKVAPVGMGTPRFDWREMQRWGISESRLPPGSEVYFRTPTVWEQYRLHVLGAGAAILIQALAILWLLYEHRRRHAAEVLARNTMAELQSVNRLAAAGELSASIAHEVKQPLTTVAANAYAALNWLGAGRLNVDEARKSLNQIVGAVHRANDIVSEVRAIFSKQEQGKSLVDINELISSTLTTVRLNLREYDIEVETQLDDRLPLIEGHRVQLQQVILNLVMNAIEAMQSARTRMLRVYSGRSPSGGVRVSIEDTGAGIDAGNLDRIFKPLFTTKARGMGMGLSICRSIVEAHGGRIRASTSPQGGAVFEVELPLSARARQNLDAESKA
jgi:C4-dicarboxylate-specific signal transduction histidine kinase